MSPAFFGERTTLYAGECKVLPRLPVASIDALIAARGLGIRAIGIERDRSHLPALICRVRQAAGPHLGSAA